MRGEVETYGMSYGGEDSGQVRGTDPETHRHRQYGYYTYKEYSVVVGMHARIHYTPTCGTTSCGVPTQYVSTVWSNATYNTTGVVHMGTVDGMRARIPHTTYPCTAHICGVVYTRTRTYTGSVLVGMQ